ncbi:S8 family serine peptidase [Roseateles sp. BYS87W]|uniref:S8 family serine peptidase n=1 Tax=Pelomonas baiyunensis TaxID=3299026 RepID=A0ABW7H1Y6_9BURK
MNMKMKPAALATLVLLSGLATSSFAQDRKTYIVQLKDEPAASYQGTVPGYAATQPTAGEPFRYSSAAVQAYVNYLSQQQSNVLSLVGNAPVLATYNTVFNGFAASLTDDEARALSANAQVAGLWQDEARKVDTISTSKFLGLTAAGGLWSQSIGGSAIKGENMVVGIVDGGIWPENPAFFDRVDANGVPSNNPADALAYGPAPASFSGTCVAGPGIDPAKHCNNKLIGIRHFNAGFKQSGQTLHWTDFPDSGRDSVGGATGHGGHGDHTASTAAGNANVTAIVNGLALGQASGVAPRARVASYKVCWTYDNPAATDGTGSQNSCYTSDSVSAIDRAVADGVNVINFSISGSQTSVNDPVEQAFYRAALAGVFVAASAGNSGPGTAVAHVSPWLTTVGASTHDRAFSGDATLGNGAKYTGSSLTQGSVAAGTPMIRAEDAGLGGNASLCFSDAAAAAAASQVTLDPAKVTGKIVVCTRGTNARVDKSLAVKNAGGVGMVLVDNGAGPVAEAHSVPTVHVSAADGALIKTYAQTAGATGAVSNFYIGTTAAPFMANFSSRGPNQGDSNVMKPDLTAPGVDIIAQVTPALNQADRDAVANGTLVPGAAWASYQGTSMSSPHVAGLALLLKQAHPTWGPGAIKSALMTTAYSTLNDGVAGLSNGLLPWSQGAGHVQPNVATDPGLVYNAGKNDWVKYQCKVNRAAVSPASDCTTIGTLGETYELNLPSITVGTVVGSVNVPRTVTNVGATTATYTPAISLPGFTTTVTPASLTLAPGASASFTVKITPTTAAEGVWSYGQLVWTDGSHNVRIPVQAKVGKSITAPAELTANTASGTRLMTVRTGFNGRMGSKVGGFKDVTMSPAATLTPQAISSTGLKAVCQAGVDTASVKVYSFTVPAGAMVARFALRDADVGAAGDDNDLMVLYPNNTTSVYSGNDGSNEAVQITAPTAGTYKVCVAAYGGDGPTMTHQLSSWIVSPGEGTGIRVALPSQVYAGSTATVGLTWSGLPTGKRVLGGFQLTDLSGNAQTTTVLRVVTDGSVPVLNEPATVSSKVSEVAKAQ